MVTGRPVRVLLSAGVLFAAVACSHSTETASAPPTPGGPLPSGLSSGGAIAAAPSSPPPPGPATPRGPSLTGCLADHGYKTGPERAPAGSDAEVARALEACVPAIGPGMIVRFPVTKGDAFLQCLAGHGLKVPAPGGVLPLDRARPVVDKAYKACAR